MSELERLAAACVLGAFRGESTPGWIHRAIEGGLGGIVLFADNVRDREQLAALTADLHARNHQFVVAVDEEGGDVTRLEAAEGSSYPGNLALGVVDDVELTEAVAQAIGSELAAAGVDLNLAPVADVNVDPANPAIGVRSFGADPVIVAAHTAAFVRGTQAAGVAACAKHFPGHGHTTEDSHVALPTIDLTREDLDAGPLLPFVAAIDAGVRSIMSAHIVLPALDEAPATLSPRILDELLRGELEFGGLVVTDALEMRAISGAVGIEEGAVRALEAGADALCIGHLVDERLVRSVVDAIATAVRDGRLREQRLREAASRLARVRVQLPIAPVDPLVGRDAATRALRIDGDAAIEAPLQVIELHPDPLVAAGPQAFGLGDALRARSDGVEIVRAERADPPPAPGAGRFVLVLRDAHRHPWQRALAAELLARRPDAVVVETGLPVWRPPSSRAYVATHGAGRVNLEAAAEVLLPGRDRNRALLTAKEA